MDVAEVPWRRLPQFSVSSRSSWLLSSGFPVSSYMFARIGRGERFRLTLCFGVSPIRARSASITAAQQEQPARLLKGSCEVVWIVEADLAPNEHLYVTGDPSALGSWEPDCAISMYPTGNDNEWEAKVKIASGVNFRYNYFCKDESSFDVIWRPGPQFSVSVPSAVNRDRKVIIRDSWMSVSSHSQESYLWGSWIDDAHLLPHSATSGQSEDEYTFSDSAVEVPRPLLNDKQLGGESFFCDELATFSSENSDFSALFSDNYQPIEEPWFLQEPVTLQHASNMQTDSEQVVESSEEVEQNLDTDEEDHQLAETLLPDDEFFKRESVSTTILINSSICTVQRIAVLDGEKLVELLLEPVKTNVQCDSVYLGVVTKFVPHMGGAFVNIGSSRHSFMDIKPNREPFIFPPFCDGSKKQAADGSRFDSVTNIPAPHETEHASYDFEASSLLDIDSNDPGESFHDDDDDHENDEDHVSDALVNGTVVNHGGLEGGSDKCNQGDELHLEVGSENGFVPLEGEHSTDSLVSNASVGKSPKNMSSKDNKWIQVRKGTKIIVQVVKEGLGTKGPTLTAYPKLRSRFWVLMTRCKRIGVSKKISGIERTRLKVIAKTLQPQGFGLTVRTVAAGHSLEELQKDLEGLLSTWKTITEEAKSASLAADEGVEGAIPALLHRAMGQTLSVVQDYFNNKVEKMVVDSPRTYHEVTNYLQDMAPDLCDRVELHDKGIPLFDLYNIEEEIEGILSKRVPLPNGGSLVIEQTEALVSIDVNGGHGMFGQGNSQEKAILEVNLTAARQIAREIRLRDIGGIIVVDFIDMADESNKRLVYEEVKKAVERDRSLVKVSELSRHGLMEITRKRVRPSVTFMISEPCSCCHATGRVEALETSFSKIEQEICRQLAKMEKRGDLENPKSWPRFILRVDSHMSSFLTTGKRTKLAILSSALKVWILLKVARHFTKGTFEVKPFMDEKTVSERPHQVAISLLKKADAIADSSGKKKLTLIPKNKDKTGGKHRR
ncbi:Ribonuclease E/G-like protein [Hirschfeldia incana]|nr:Ribonuclease E/G-like protein [Hirschfeldia incana]